MPHSASIYSPVWMPHHGKVVKLDGEDHVIECREWTATYPRTERVISVSATPVDKNSELWLTTAAVLKDSWSVDVLDSDVEIQTEILTQLQ